MASWTNKNNSVYIIAEVGQNHNGDIYLAKKLIDVAAMPVFDYFTGETLPGVNAVKFTKRDLNEELTTEAANKPYISPHAFGSIYIEHRKALELSTKEHKELEVYAHEKGLDFVETMCSPGCLELLETIKIDAIKIASRDVTNIPLLQELGKLKSDVIISSGMCSLEELRDALGILSCAPKNIAILHCISEYPAQYQNINLSSIPYLKELFPKNIIGYSDHSIGIVVPIAAIALGAGIIEKHITLNRNMKGSDHAGSLEPEGLWRMVRDIRNIERTMGIREQSFHQAVQSTREKLARSLAIQVSLAKGETLLESCLCMRSPGNGMSWEERKDVIGKKAKHDLSANTLLHRSDVE